MPNLCIPLNQAQKSLAMLREKNLIDSSFEFKKTKTHLIVRVKKRIKIGFSWTNIALKKKNFKPKNLKDALKSLLSRKQLDLLVSSFRVMGNIAVIEIPKSLEKKQKLVGSAILQTNNSIKTVFKIAGEHQTVFRTQPLKKIAGLNNFVAEYKENGCIFVFNVRDVFFSPRLAFERLRIAKLIKPEEVVGVFFAGVGPFPIVFAKNSLMKKAIAVELNPKAFVFLRKNIKLNKLDKRVDAIKGDVRRVVFQKKFENFFDRIVMPLPKNSSDFLDSAFFSVKHNGIVHFYQFVDKRKGFQQAIDLIESLALRNDKKVQFLNQRIIREISASRMQIVIDFKVK